MGVMVCLCVMGVPCNILTKILQRVACVSCLRSSLTLNICIYGAPGAGKSTMMAALFSGLKMAGVDAEMAPEYVKRKIWEESYGVLDDQIYIFGKQNHSMQMLQGSVDVVITDSPIMLSLMYGEDVMDADIYKPFSELVTSVYKQMDSINIFVLRSKYYNTNGRTQSEAEADEVGRQTRLLLERSSIEYIVATGDEIGTQAMLMHIRGKLDAK